MHLRAALYAAVLLIIATSPAVAWNSLGHKTVAEIAWQQLEPAQRKIIVDTLRRHPGFDADFAKKMDDNALTGDKSVEDHWIFQHAATWPDLIRKSSNDRPEWHYIDLPQYLDPSDQMAFAKRLPVNVSTEYPGHTPLKEMNVVQAIAFCQAMLKGKAGPDVKAQAYCWLFHLVGDIHQPLHCTALFSVDHFPKGDKGGNEILITKGKNLHSLWDCSLGKQYYMRNVAKSVSELSDRERFGNVWDLSAKEMNPIDWAKDRVHGARASKTTTKVLAAETISLIKQLYDSGQSIPQIVSYLKAEKLRSEDGAVISYHCISKYLNNKLLLEILPKSGKTNLENYAEQWLVAAEPHCRIATADIYADYLQWCKSNNQPAAKINNLSQLLGRLGYSRSYAVGEKRIKGYAGVKIKDGNKHHYIQQIRRGSLLEQQMKTAK